MSSLPAGARADALRLGAVSLATSAVAMRGFGRYSDDWNFFVQLDRVASGSIVERMSAAFGGWPSRPVQAFAHALLHRIADDRLVAHYLLLALLDLAAVLLLHRLVLRLGGSRALALSASLIFTVLPHATTSRWWIASLAAALSLALVLLALHVALGLGQVAPESRKPRLLLLAALALAAAFTYEMPVPLLLLTPLLAGTADRRRGKSRSARDLAVAALAVAAPVAGAIVYKRIVTGRSEPPAEPLTWGRYIFGRIFEVGFGELGRDLPRRAAAAVGSLSTLDVAAAVLLTLFAVYATGRAVAADPPPRRKWWLAAVAGPPLFLLGYLVAFVTQSLGLSDVGLDNRTAVAAAIGVAFTFAGLGGILAGLVPRGGRAVATSLALGTIFALALLVMLRTAKDWRAAARRQEAVVAAVRHAAPRLPPEPRVIVDGACPYVGPAPVFERRLDTSRMLQATLDDPAVEGDVLRPGSTLGPAGFDASAYAVPSHFDYGPRLVVLDVATGNPTPLPDAAAAADYLAAHPESSLVRCPPSREGQGVLPVRRARRRR